MGLEPFVYREMEELKKLGLDIVIFLTKYNQGPYTPKRDWKYYKISKIPIIAKQPLYFFRNPNSYFLLFIESIKSRCLIDFLISEYYAEKMKNEHIERLHSHFGDHKLIIGYFCHKILNIPLTVTVHAYELYNGLNKPLFKKLLRACDKIITISDYNKNILITNFHIAQEKIIVTRLFADMDNANSVVNKVKMLIVALFVEKKGYDVLLKAIKTLSRDDILIWVVGGLPIPAKSAVNVKKIAKELDIEDKISFFGTVSDEFLQILYLSCDIFCLPSKTFYKFNGTISDQEGIPVALMEAMSYGKPVISTRHAGIPELVEKVLVDENNVEELAKAIELLADNPELRRKLGERNREIIEERYSKKNVLKLKDVFLGVYDEVRKKN